METTPPFLSALVPDNDVFPTLQGQLVRYRLVHRSRRTTKTAIKEKILVDTTSQPRQFKQRPSFALMETLRTCETSAASKLHPSAHLAGGVVTSHGLAFSGSSSNQKSPTQTGRRRAPISGLWRMISGLRGESLKWTKEADLRPALVGGNVEHESMAEQRGIMPE
ncbi:hypothetical protein BASA61_002064 [Batrachochytrium salamandrivorans]|nr:hypothetical protein BASA61_002064 [Batrachochytrium salamandrivorans]